ncbi:MAG TPA: sulfatase [Chloroflexota bacterium]|nr:sulfatase [Chloroflexota bacterium]
MTENRETVSGPQARTATSKRPPNVIFFMADDLGWRDTSLYGSTFYETPNIDRLATRGMTFSRAYAANPLCSPTRASVLTGLYPARVGITTPTCHLPQEVLRTALRADAPPWQPAIQAISATRLSTEYVTLADSFRAAGYATGHFGKWHLGREPYDALHQGFDVDLPHWHGPGPAGGYIAPWGYPTFHGRPGEHIEDRMAQEAVAFMRVRATAGQPFFLNYWCFSVHGPWGGKPALIDRYRAKAAGDRDNPQRNPVNGAMVHSMDDAVGTLTRAVDDLGIADNTVLIFFSDNGGVHFRDIGPSAAGAGEAFPEFTNVPITSNLPLRGGKATLYEGGTREPLVVVWPGETSPGSRSDALVSSVDFYPTLLEIAGVQAAEGQRFDGISFVPTLRGEAGAPQRDSLFCHFPHYTPATGNVPGAYVRRGDWKLIRRFAAGHRQADRHELFNVVNDVGEAIDLAAREPDLVEDLGRVLDGFLRDTRAIVPVSNPAYDSAAPSPAAQPPGADA